MFCSKHMAVKPQRMHLETFGVASIGTGSLPPKAGTASFVSDIFFCFYLPECTVLPAFYFFSLTYILLCRIALAAVAANTLEVSKASVSNTM